MVRWWGYVVLPSFGHFFLSGSASLAGGTPLFLAVTGFRAVQHILDIYTKRDG